MAKQKTERLPIEALLRQWEEEQEARRDAERVRASAAEIRRACEGPWRCWWPGMYVPPERRGFVARVLNMLGVG